MRMMTFAKRCAKEILRDPINLGFGLGFPLVLLLLLTTMQKNIPVHLFEIDTLAPGITVFGLSFMTLFSATLIAKDRESALLQRLYTTPLTGLNFVLGYMLPLLPIAIGQTVICYLFAIPLGLTVSENIVYAIIGIIPMAIFNIALGLLCGSVFGVKQVGGICGALLTNLSAWLSGVWFDLELVGGAFEKIANALPFMHAAELEKALFSGSFELAAPHILPVLLYGVLVTVIAVFCFLRQLPLMVAILIHGGVLYVSYLGTYLLNDWLDWGVMPIIVFSAIFVVGYVVIWAIIYSITKKNTEKLNEMLKQKQQNP